MSIINDALKKAQWNLKNTKKNQKDQDKPNDPTVPENKSISKIYEKLYKTSGDQQTHAADANRTSQESSGQTATKYRRAKRWFAGVLIFALCGLGARGGYLLLKRYRPFENFFRSSTLLQGSKGLQSPKPVVPKRTYKEGEFVLNGTSLIDGKKVALINGEIYEIGEVVNGKTITSIDSNKVELTDDEKIITLRVH